jgi:lipopolysaccharide/colanic/teichoic acid biosynthesis glycosyltransferase
MSLSNKRRSLALLLGDVLALAASLWLALALRYGEVPSHGILAPHAQPFLIVGLAWVVAFAAAGLYETLTSTSRDRIVRAVVSAQVWNAGLAVAFFYFVPYFSIAPKTILFIFVAVSTALLVLWRRYGAPFLLAPARLRAAIVGEGDDVDELARELAANPDHGIVPSYRLAADKLGGAAIPADVQVVVADLSGEEARRAAPNLYNLLFANVSFLSLHATYEEIFGRVPSSLVSHGWFLENIRTRPHVLYDAAKRAFDIVLSLPILAVVGVLLPFVWIARRVEGNRPLFSYQDRIGQGGRTVRIVKLATMLWDDNGEWHAPEGQKNRVTPVGRFLRRTRIDELPQAWNVLRGDLSLIGPRPFLPAETMRYMETVPYYSARHLIKPGLTGWAQIYGEHAHHRADEGVMRNKLSYDLYYVKNRSFWLDLIIALRTAATIVRMEGR